MNKDNETLTEYLERHSLITLYNYLKRDYEVLKDLPEEYKKRLKELVDDLHNEIIERL